MKKLLLTFFILLGLSSNAQVTVFQDGFETYDNFIISGIGNWVLLDLDGLNTYTGGLPTGGTAWPNSNQPQAYQIFNPSAAGVTNATSGNEVRNFDPKTGLKYAACWAGVPAGAINANNDWLVSPVLNLGASNNEVRFWVKSMSNTYGLEKYRVGVYVGTGTPAFGTDFAIISGLTDLTAPYPNWEEKIFSLNTYSNQSIRIGIQCKSSDAYMFMVDDFIVTSSNLNVNDVISSKFSLYPNPANNVLNISNADNILMDVITINDINGRIVKNSTVDNLSATQINISDLQSGVYFVNINSTEGIATKKFVKI